MPEPDLLVCLPPSGTGRSFYRRWPRRLGGAVVRPLSLPGHEERMREPLVTSVAEAARDITDRIAALAPDRLVLFGHSLGAVVAYESARLLADLPHPPGLSLVVSARHAPHLSGPARAALDSDDTALLKTVAGWGGGIPGTDASTAGGGRPGADARTVAPAPEGPAGELAALTLPALRADLAMSAAYRWTGRPLQVPLTAVAYTEDSTAPPAAVAAWDRAASGPFRRLTLPGGHFTAGQAPADLLEILAESVTAVQG